LVAQAEAGEITSSAKNAWEKLLRKEVRTQVVSKGLRIDGRQTDEIRPIWSETGISPRAHGSVVFTRGETQSFVTATLGVGRDSQRIDNPGVSEERTWRG
jgi:polyribonucleotide nucleotidyltransferase